jgi:transcriptional regulator with XRE-family HTH domain
MARTRNFVDVIRTETKADPELAEMVEEEYFNADVAAKVYEARKALNWTQKKLAERAKTTQSVISRIEAADYDGHTLKFLRRIAKAMGMQLQVEFYACVPTSSEVVETLTPAWKFSEWPTSAEWVWVPATLAEAPTKPLVFAEVLRQTGALSGTLAEFSSGPVTTIIPEPVTSTR